jgi:hypothetical protein
MNRQLILMTTAATFAIAGCMNTGQVDNPVDIISNQQYVVDMTKADVQPTREELAGGRAKVIVLPLQNESSQEFGSGAAMALVSKIDGGLNDVGVESLDRRLANSLGEEIMAYEQTGEFSGAGIDLAGFAILPTLSNVQLGGTYVPPTTYTQDGQTKYTPAVCKYTGVMTGSVKVYKLPDLSIVDAININGDASQSTNVSVTQCPINELTASSLVSSAAENGIFAALPQIQKHFVQSAYVLEYRKREKEHIVQISMGSNQGLKAGQVIEFVRQQKSTHPVTGKVTITQIPFEFTGKVTQVNQGDLAWVKIAEEAEGVLQFGDMARQKFEVGFFDKVLQRAGYNN